MSERKAVPMPSYDFADPDEFEACLRVFLAEQPALQTESQDVAHATGRDQLWLSPEGMMQFLAWACAKRYISAAETHWAITRMRAQTPYNPRPHAE